MEAQLRARRVADIKKRYQHLKLQMSANKSTTFTIGFGARARALRANYRNGEIAYNVALDGLNELSARADERTEDDDH